MLPLSLLRSVGALKYASAFGITALFVVIIYAIGRGFNFGTSNNLTPAETTDFVSFSVGTSLLFFALNNQFNTIEIYSELTDRTPMRYTKMIFTTMLIISVLYVVMGLSELMEFGANVTGNVLKSYDGSSPLAAVMIIAVMCKVTFSFPLLIFPTRDAILHLFGNEDLKAANQKLYYGATVVIAGGSFAIGIVAPTVTTLFGIIGSLSVGTFAFILPSLYFWRFSILSLMTEGIAEDTWVSKVHIAVNVLNFVIGCFIIVAGTAGALIEL
ncbi:amino acid transporter, putative [Bodo saltans]|uniref:Amino acid transporter, putative n=1 Tax=Bodo saltans TaxID=75058 RepID=A0A0S4JEJ9_BODSA|nr:amino acid transporter, putative [Bodo saltans]|eukprot:CUG88544.1 amino acid transporter, putative [Bodo saltans]